MHNLELNGKFKKNTSIQPRTLEYMETYINMFDGRKTKCRRNAIYAIFITAKSNASVVIQAMLLFVKIKVEILRSTM